MMDRMTLPCRVLGSPGPGFMVFYLDSSNQPTVRYCGKGVEASEVANNLMAAGIRPTVFALTKILELERDGDRWRSLRLPDDWQPLINRIVATQQQGGGMQYSPRSPTRKSAPHVLGEARQWVEEEYERRRRQEQSTLVEAAGSLPSDSQD